MPRTFFGMTALCCVLIFAPFAWGQSTTTPQQESVDLNNDGVIQNLCDPYFDGQFNQESTPLAMDYQQLQNVRIELLERGFNPGFNSEMDNASYAQLMEAVGLFQSEYRLPVTGQMDMSTLAALSIPVQKSNPTISEELLQRAKPSR